MKEPAYLSVIPEGIPGSLKLCPNFVAWKSVKRNGEWTKPPVNPQDGALADSTDSRTWGSFDSALAYYLGHKDNGIRGVGFELGQKQSDTPFAGIDLDHCRHPETGIIEEWARAIIDKIDSYAEISPSATGIRIIAEGTLPRTGRKKGDLEMYDCGRYVTVTGWHLEGTPATVEARHDEIMAVHKEYFGEQRESTKDRKTEAVTGSLSEEDAKLLEKALRAANGDKFERLWSGDWSDHPSQSEADMALCLLLSFWTRRDVARMDRLFRQSGLYRPKWDEPHYSGGKTYGEECIQRAIERTTETYAAEGRRVKEGQEVNVARNNDSDIITPVPFPFEVFPGAFRNLIHVYARGLQIDPQLAALLKMTVVSGAVGNAIRVSVKEGWAIPPFLWTAVIKESGYGQSPSQNAILRPVRRLQAKDTDRYNGELSAYHEAERKARNDKSAVIPDKPKAAQKLVSDITVEALADVFEHDGRGVIVDKDELSGLVYSFNQYRSRGGDDRQKWLSLFNCEPWKIDRKSGTRFIKNTGAAIIGGIQKKILPDVFNDRAFDDGLLPRFVLYEAPVKADRFNDQGVDVKSSVEWADIVKMCYEIPCLVDEDGFISPKVLTLPVEAREQWKTFHDQCSEITPFLSEKMRVFIPKLKAYYSLKFAGILQVLHSLCRQEPIPALVSEQVVMGAIALTRYFMREAVNALKLYHSEEKPLNEYQVRLIKVLHSLQGEVRNGKLAVGRITAFLNGDLPASLRVTEETTSGMLKGLGLTTKRSTGNYAYLIWEEGKIEKLFSRISLTSLTMAGQTDAQGVDEVKEVNVGDNTFESDNREGWEHGD